MKNLSVENSFAALPLEERIKVSYQNLERMRHPNGGYVASPYNAEDNAGDAYNVFWIRDIMYATYANEYLGCYNKMIESFRLVLEIFKKHHMKFVQASIIKPHLLNQRGQFMPARVHPTTLETITEEWGHHQLDVFGLFMYKLGDLVKKGFGLSFTAEDYHLMGHIRNYIFNMGFEADFGVWEEGPEEHASSYGAVLGGLTMWFDQGHYDYKYRNKISISQLVPVSERMIAEGYSALMRLLPRESAGRPYDLAQLSLIWPYNIVDYETKAAVLAQIETHLAGPHGIARYPGDKYCGNGLRAGHDGPAQWPLGLAWLAICFAKFAESGRDFDLARHPVHINWPEREQYFLKALMYFERLEKNMTPAGEVPEMYVGGQAGHNTPLAWAQSLHIIAAQTLLNLAHAHPQHFKIPAQIRFGQKEKS